MDGAGSVRSEGDTSAGALGATSGSRQDGGPMLYREDSEAVDVTLGDASGRAPSDPRPPLADAAWLEPAEVERILARVAPLTPDATDRAAFSLRAGTAPPPRTGAIVEERFPPEARASAPGPAPSAPLTVLRYGPEGAVAIAPRLSVTFSQPMVAVTSQDAAAARLPVTIVPAVPGEWRWTGTRTLVFQPEQRFPMATRYSARISAGTPSATGATLANDLAWTFETPAPRVVRYAPQDGPHPLDPLIWLEMDQRVDPTVIQQRLEVMAGGRQRIAVRAADDAEIAALLADVRVSEGRIVALRAVDPLPAGERITLRLPAGVPSAEGSLLSEEPWIGEFSTYPPLAVESIRCGWRRGQPCDPSDPVIVRMNNPIDRERFTADMVTVDPPLAERSVSVSGNTLAIEGPKRARTKYAITLSRDLPDVFGQRLGSAARATIDTGDAARQLLLPGGPLISTDPARPASLSIFTRGLRTVRVSASRVAPADWAAAWSFAEDRRFGRPQPVPPPGVRVFDGDIEVEGEPDGLTETVIELARFLDQGRGHLLVTVDLPLEAREPQPRVLAQSEVRWVQATEIGLTALADPTELEVFATRLQDGEPLAGVEIRAGGIDGSPSAVTGADGVASLARPSAAEPADGSQSLLLARLGDDVAILPSSDAYWRRGSGWSATPRPDTFLWHVFDDRGVYRPGETVKLRGWVRVRPARAGSDVERTEATVSRVEWVASDPMGTEIARGSAPLEGLGGFDLAFDLPDTASLGPAAVVLSPIGAPPEIGPHVHTFGVQEFRRPEFEVKTSVEEGPFFLGARTTASVLASYYAGGGLADAPVEWSVTATEASFVPPNRGDFSFGPWTPWWIDAGPWARSAGASRRTIGRGGSRAILVDGYLGASPVVVTRTARTDATGRDAVELAFTAMRSPRPASLELAATVTDVNRQAWASRSTILVHPSELYVGLRAKRPFAGLGDPVDVEAIVVDLDGEAVADRAIEVRFERLVAGGIGFSTGDDEVDAKLTQRCEITSGIDAVSCRFVAGVGGSWRVTARTTDDAGRMHVSELRLFVSGEARPPSRSVEHEQLVLVPSSERVQPGETFAVLVSAPFFPAHGVWTLSRDGMIARGTFELEGPSTTLELPIEERHVPGVTLQVEVVGSADRALAEGQTTETLPRRPALAGATLEIEVPPLRRTLDVSVAPAATAVGPGDATRLDILVRDASGAPVSEAELAVVVVDEAILALSQKATPDPIAVFYGARPGLTDTVHSRTSIVLADPEALRPSPTGGPAVMETASDMSFATASRAAPPPSAPLLGRGKAASGPGEPSISLRTDLRPLALFAPRVRTDRTGRASVPLTLPESLTRYRVMVVAAAETRQFGSAEAAITARLPIVVRPSAPRFLNFGDRFELPLVVQNQTEEPVEVRVALRAANATVASRSDASARSGAGSPISSGGQRLVVPANDRREIRFEAATQSSGRARFQAVVASSAGSDAAGFELPVWTPATTEAFATYGELDASSSTVQPIVAPPDVWPQHGELTVTTSSTQLQALTDALLYLVQYPFDCSEQIASRILAVTALRDVLEAFDVADLPPPDALRASVERDLELLAARQAKDGGWAFFGRDSPSWPYPSLHAALALANAQAKGFAPREATIQASLGYLRSIEQHIPEWYGDAARHAVRSLALLVRHRLGDTDLAEARALLARPGIDGLSIEALGWLLPVLSAGGAQPEIDAILRHLDNRVDETAAQAHFVTSYQDQGYVLLHSERRADAVVLDALIQVRPESDLIPKLVRGLLAHRTQGRWHSTQESAHVLLALDRYLARYEAETPDFVARVWLGDGLAGDQRFRGRSTAHKRISIPMSYLAQLPGTQPLVLSKSGDAGRLYYRIGLTYAPRDLMLTPSDRGFEVSRTYHAIDDPGDVTRDADGAWHIRAGARVRARIEMVATGARTHVALVDPLPAGLEVINPALATSEPIRIAPGTDAARRGAWARTWYEHQNLRDERVEAFTTYLYPGAHVLEYTARATTPGSFVAPPAKAEQMYEPETFGRSATDRVIVEPRTAPGPTEEPAAAR